MGLALQAVFTAVLDLLVTRRGKAYLSRLLPRTLAARSGRHPSDAAAIPPRCTLTAACWQAGLLAVCQLRAPVRTRGSRLSGWYGVTDTTACQIRRGWTAHFPPHELHLALEDRDVITLDQGIERNAELLSRWRQRQWQQWTISGVVATRYLTNPQSQPTCLGCVLEKGYLARTPARNRLRSILSAITR